MSVRAFAQEFDINLATFRNWLYKKQAAPAAADDGCNLVEVEAAKVRQCRDSQNIRIHKNGMEIFIQFCIENEEKLPCFEKDFDGTKAGKQHLFNYCDEPAYDMNHLVLDCYKALGKPKTKLIHFPYWLAYFGGLCFDLLAFILHKKFAINSIRVKKFCQNTYFKSSWVPQTGFSAPAESL